MSIDPTILTETTMKLLDRLETEKQDRKIVAVGIVVVMDDDEDDYMRTETSCEHQFEAVGLFRGAFKLVDSMVETEDDEE